MLLIALTSNALAMTPTFGVEYTPLSRSDLTWVTDIGNGGTGVSEFDGFINPNLTPFFGVWFTENMSLVTSLGVASTSSTTWVDDIFETTTLRVIRPSLSLRLAPWGQPDDDVSFSFSVGGHGDIPKVTQESNGYSEEEKDIADIVSLEEQYRLGGGGGHFGIGSDISLLPHLLLGAEWRLEGHWNTSRTTESATLDSWLSSRGIIRLTFQ